MQTVTLKIEVLDGEVTQATEELKQLGYEAKKVEKATKDVGKTTKSSLDGVNDSASNLQGGVQGVGEEFVKVGKAAKVGGRAMKTALISTGVGALVVALGFVVENWDKIGRAIGLINPSLEEQIELSKKLQKTTELRVDLLDKEIKLSEKQGLATEKLQEQRINLIKLLQQQKEEQISLLESEALSLKTSALELTTREKIVKAILNAAKAGSGDALILSNQEAALERYKEIQDLILKAKGEQVDLDIKLFDLENKKSEVANPEKRDKVQGVQDKGLESGIADPFNEQKALDAARLQALQEGTEEFALEQQNRIDLEVEALTKSAEIQNRQTQQDKENAEARVRIAEAEFQAKQMLLDGISGSLDAVSELVGRQTGAGKALAVASALIDTYAAIAAQLRAAASSPGAAIPGYAIAQAVATGLAGFAAVKNILKVKVPYDQGGQGGSFSGGGGVSAPAFNVVGQSGVNQLAQSLNQEQQPIRAYVVGGDVTSQQEFDRNIQQTASI